MKPGIELSIPGFSILRFQGVSLQAAMYWIITDNAQRPFIQLDWLYRIVDWTSKVIRDDKRAAISATAPPILQRLDTLPKTGST